MVFRTDGHSLEAAKSGLIRRKIIRIESILSEPAMMGHRLDGDISCGRFAGLKRGYGDLGFPSVTPG